jgi:TolB protein
MIGASQLGSRFPGAELAYLSGSSREPDIFRYDVDRQLAVNLTDDDRFEAAFAWSPDGTSIAFIADRDKVFTGRNRINLYLMDVDGENVRNLTRGAVNWLDAFITPIWSPNGIHIAFASNPPGTASQDRLYVIRSDGSNLFGLSPNPESSEVFPPSWSPDGKQIAFISNPYRDNQFYISDVVRGTLNLLPIKAISILDAVWSPDGHQIAFKAFLGGMSSFNVFTIQPDGSGLRQLTHDLNGVYGASWSPDGRRINLSSGNELYLVEAACPNSAPGCIPAQHNLTQSPDSNEWNAVWSPDGRQLAAAFFSRTTHFTYLTIMDVNGSTRRLFPLVNRGSILSGITPLWSPDGRYLAYVVTWEDNHAELYVMNLTTFQTTRIASHEYLTLFAAWRP